MKNTLKRLGALLIAAIMMIAMCVPVMAADPTPTPVPPSGTDRAVISVLGVDSKDTGVATVTAYRIVSPEYNSEGLVKYNVADGLSIADTVNFRPTSEEVTAMATTILANPSAYTSVILDYDATSNSFKSANPTDATADAAKKAGAGEYLVLITGTNTNVYNPALVSINYTDANNSGSITSGTVDLASPFAYGNETYVKKSEPDVTKSIVTDDGDKKGTTVSADGDNTTVGDTINFKITADIPSYKTSSVTTTTENASGDPTTITTVTGTYDHPIVRVTDKLDATFTEIIDVATTGIVVKNGTTELQKGADKDYTITVDTDKKGFVIQLTEAYIFDHGGDKITVTYSAKLSDVDTAQNFDENKNIVKLEYSNDPSNDNSVKTKEDVTYNYTFAIDGKIGGEDVTTTHGDDQWHETTPGNETSYEVVKEKTTTTERTWENYTDGLTTFTGGTSKKPSNALADAEFSLYTEYDSTKKDVTGNPVAVTTSDDGGHLYFHGLNKGTYYVKETKAPAGYSLNSTIYKVVIEATVNETTGVLESYSITFYNAKDDSEAGSISYTNTATQITDVYTTDGEGNPTTTVNEHFGEVTTNVNVTISPLEILDTPLADLPSTGGMGSYLFTIIGVAVMAIVAGSYFRSRAKKA